MCKNDTDIGYMDIGHIGYTYVPIRCTNQDISGYVIGPQILPNHKWHSDL